MVAEQFAVNIATNALPLPHGANNNAEILDMLRLIHGELEWARTHPTPFGFHEEMMTLAVNVEKELTYDNRPPHLLHTSIFVVSSAVVNVLVKYQFNDIAVALPQNRWTALEFPLQPSPPTIRLATAGTQISAILRYADERWGAVLP